MKKLYTHIHYPILALCMALCACSADAPSGPPPEPPPVPVEVQKPRVETILETVESVGTLEPNEFVDIKPEIAGTIRELFFSEGETIGKNELLIKLDPAEQQANLKAAQATLKLAELNHKRGRQLLKEDTISPQEFDEISSRLTSAQAEVELAREMLDRTDLKAPFAGIVGQRFASKGQYVQVGETIVSLYELDPMKISFSVPERFAGVVKPQQKVTLTTAAYPQERFTGTVYLIDPALDPATRTVKLKATIPNPGHKLKPGMFANLSLTYREIPEALTVPEAATFAFGDGFALFIARNNKAVQQTVELGIRKPGRVQIVGGIREGDLVITSNIQKLSDGNPIIPQPTVREEKPVTVEMDEISAPTAKPTPAPGDVEPNVEPKK